MTGHKKVNHWWPVISVRSSVVNVGHWLCLDLASWNIANLSNLSVRCVWPARFRYDRRSSPVIWWSEIGHFGLKISTRAPSRAEPSRVELSWVELSWVELSWVELSWVELSWVESSWVESSRVESSRVESSRVESSRVESSRVESSRVESSRVESSRVESSRVESSRVESRSSMTSGSCCTAPSVHLMRALWDKKPHLSCCARQARCWFSSRVESSRVESSRVELSRDHQWPVAAAARRPACI